jgi:protein tyrosine/serine phosphatase
VLDSRRIPFTGPLNFRDIGGYRGLDGRLVRWRLVYRADGLHRLTDADLVTYSELGIATVYDLRSGAERLDRPDPMPSVHIHVEAHVPRREFEDGSLLQTAVQAEDRLRDVYLAMLRTGGPLFGELLAGIAQPARLPAVLHCAGGKDRTGVAVALLLDLLGVDRPTILDDYELTNESVTPARRLEIVELFTAAGISHEAALALLGAPRWAMVEALEWLQSQYGGAEAYLSQAGGLSRQVIAALRANLLEPAAD